MVEPFIPILLEILFFLSYQPLAAFIIPLLVPIVRQTIKLSDLASFV